MMKPEEALKILEQIAECGLFIARLNNGDWMVGKASYLYHITPDQHHYRDPKLCISRDLGQAVARAAEELKEEQRWQIGG